MSERDKQVDFLKSLILYENTEERHLLEDKIKKAAQEEKCIQRVFLLVMLLELLSLAGLGYSAVLLPEFFANSKPFLVKFFCALGLGSAICMVVFGGYWMWYRAVTNDLHEECRRFVRALLASRLQTPSSSSSRTVIRKQEIEVYQIATSMPQPETRTLTLNKVS